GVGVAGPAAAAGQQEVRLSAALLDRQGAAQVFAGPREVVLLQRLAGLAHAVGGGQVRVEDGGTGGAEGGQAEGHRGQSGSPPERDAGRRKGRAVWTRRGIHGGRGADTVRVARMQAVKGWGPFSY